MEGGSGALSSMSGATRIASAAYFPRSESVVASDMEGILRGYQGVARVYFVELTQFRLYVFFQFADGS